MDAIDKKLLHILAENAEIPTTELARLVNLSVPAVNKRIKKLKDDKTIRAFTIITDSEQTEKPILAFILVVLQYNQGVEDFMHFVESEKDILECFAVSGEYDYILKVCARDIRTLEQKLLQLKSLRGIAKSRTMLSLMEHKLSPTILPDDADL